MMTRSKLKAARKKRKVNKDSTTLPEQDNMELIPDIPQDVTLQVISTKLPWSTIQALSAVSRAWQQAVRSREIFAARVHSHSTDNLVVISHALSRNTFGITLYSLRDGASFQLPRIPRVRCGVPESCQCLTLDGKIYILGGLANRKTLIASNDVYMLDLAGQGKWEKCACMDIARLSFGCSIIDGKIYVCGGFSSSVAVDGTEVYDPKVDVWTTIMPMPSLRGFHAAGTAENELLVYGGSFYLPTDPQAYRLRYIASADHVDMYNPTTDNWRRLPQTLETAGFQTWFVANDRLHSITGSEICVHDLETNSQTRLQSISTESGLMAPEVSILGPFAFLVVGDVLLALELFSAPALELDTPVATLVLLKGSGFGTEDKEIVWEKANWSASFDRLPGSTQRGAYASFLCPLRL